MQRWQRAAAVISCAGQNDADRTRPIFLGQRIEQKIDRQAGVVARYRPRKVQHAKSDRHELAGRADVNGVGVDRHPLNRLAHAHGRMGAQQLGQLAGVVRIKMLDQQESSAGIGRQHIKQPRHRFKSASRSPDRHHRHQRCSGATRLGRRRSGTLFRLPGVQDLPDEPVATCLRRTAVRHWSAGLAAKVPACTQQRGQGGQLSTCERTPIRHSQFASLAGLAAGSGRNRQQPVHDHPKRVPFARRCGGPEKQGGSSPAALAPCRQRHRRQGFAAPTI